MRESERLIFIICPVRGLLQAERRFLNRYIERLEQEGYTIYWPPRDTPQDDPVGLDICARNRQAISQACEVHVYWNPRSEGSKFDLGMAFMARKPIVLINREQFERTPYKSFTNVLLELDKRRATSSRSTSV
jgi:hypothetical protein